MIENLIDKELILGAQFLFSLDDKMNKALDEDLR